MIKQDSFLSAQEIIDSFIKYLENSIYNYAYMIDGSWGSGKTFFVRELLVPAIQEHESDKKKDNSEYKEKEVLYVSLYGIKDTEEISRLLYLELKNVITSKAAGTKFSEENKKKISSWLGTGAKIFSDILKDTKGIDLENILSKIASGFSLDNCIFIFDDLERTSCSINDILGYINNFIEHDGIKVLLIANEEEINTASQLELNPEEVLVCLQDKLDFSPLENTEKKNSGYNSYSNSQQNNKTITLTQLMKRVDILFARNQAYKQIKEKVVGETVKYQPVYKDMIVSLTQTHLNNNVQLKELVLRRCNTISNIAHHYDHLNLRTFLFFLSKMVSLQECLNDHEDTLEKMIDYTFLACVRCKSGREPEKWESKALFGTTSLFDWHDFRNTCLAFRFIDEFILFGKFDHAEIKAIVNQYECYERQNAEDKNDPANKLNNWWIMEDEVIISIMDAVLEKMDRNEYGFAIYYQILNNFVSIVNAEFNESYLLHLMTSMERNIKKSTEPVEFQRTHFSLAGNEDREIYRKMVDILNEIAEAKNKSFHQAEVNNIYTDESNWAERIRDYISKQPNRYDAPLFKMIDVQEIVHLIDISNSENIDTFRGSVASFYSFANIADYYMDDYEPLSTLYDGLDDQKEGYDRIKRMNIRWLKKLISDIIEKLKPSKSGFSEDMEDSENETLKSSTEEISPDIF